MCLFLNHLHMLSGNQKLHCANLDVPKRQVINKYITIPFNAVAFIGDKIELNRSSFFPASSLLIITGNYNRISARRNRYKTRVRRMDDIILANTQCKRCGQWKLFVCAGWR